ncbi:hypothetical protein LQW54_011862 [Pestalotiopsis sp. IQ-011]
MDATTVQDDAAPTSTVVKNGPEANSSPDSRLPMSLLEALDAVQPAAAANSPDQGQGADGACGALSSGADEQITNILKSSPLGRARVVAERVAGICETGQEFDVFLATLEKKTVSPPGDFSREDCKRWLKKVYEDDEDISDE